MYNDSDQEILIKVSSQPNGGVGWEIRLHRREYESDHAYVQRSVAAYDMVKKALAQVPDGPDLITQLQESIDILKRAKRRGGEHYG